MVKHYPNHEVHLLVMECFGQGLQVICCPKPAIEFGDTSDLVSMIWVTVWLSRAIVVLVDWADPNGSEAH